MIPLFTRYHELATALPYLELGTFPTPVKAMSKLGSETGIPGLMIKCDDVSGSLYGGNKVRKLEFLLAKAVQGGYREVLTYGGAGSNHALATALYAESLGIRCISILGPQPNARNIPKTLLMSLKAGAELHYYGNYRSFSAATKRILVERKNASGQFPMVIPVGGTTPLGTAGFVNAGLEIAEQITAGELDEPDVIYVALGSMGTAVGIALGLRAAGISAKVIAIALLGKERSNLENCSKLYERTASLLNSNDKAFPLLGRETMNMEVRQEFGGKMYGLYTPEGADAVSRMRDLEGITLEGTYTGKALAALISDAEAKKLSGKKVLFWNTYNSKDFSSEIADVDYHKLPKALHKYFDGDYQQLDQ